MEVTDIIDTDVLVAGGGPAGSSAAIQCRKHGLSCVVVDKAKFPRLKLCGGLLTVKTKDAMLRLLGEQGREELFREAQVDGSDHFSIYYKYNLLVNCYPSAPMLLVSRFKMDNFLLMKAQSVGARVIDNDGIAEIDFEEKVAVLSSGIKIRYRYLIAADGAGSKVERLLDGFAKDFKRKNPSAPVVEVNAPHQDTEALRGIFGVYFGIMKYGYACVFPRGEYTTIGVATAFKSKENLKERLREFMKGVRVRNVDSYDIKGCLIPYHNVMKNPVWHEHVLFVGDAAGLVDPLTGEGISYAMNSGMNAADAVWEAVSNGTKPSETYPPSLQGMLKIISHGAQIEKMFQSSLFMYAFRKKAARKQGFINFFYDEFIDKGITCSYLEMKRRWDAVKKQRALRQE